MTRRGPEGVLALLLLGVLGSCGQDRGDVERGYLRQMSIADHHLVKSYHEGGTYGIYLGAPTQDVLAAVSGPSLVVSPPKIDFSDRLFEYLGAGKGVTDDGVTCDVQLERLRQGIQPFPSWELGSRQENQIEAGELELIRVVVGCPMET